MYTMRIVITAILLLILTTSVPKASAQQGVHDTILVGGIVVDNDTFAMIYLPEFEKTAKLPRYLARRREQYNRLKYNIYKVYPYAVTAADVLKDIDIYLAKYENDRVKRKEYLKSLERELNKRFKGELEELTITQGQLLVRLINRQTGKNCYNIIRELKGGFSAVVWQSVGLLFGNNLRREYDPYERDKDIEAIVAELEANYYYRYKYQRQQVLMSQNQRK